MLTEEDYIKITFTESEIRQIDKAEADTVSG